MVKFFFLIIIINLFTNLHNLILHTYIHILQSSLIPTTLLMNMLSYFSLAHLTVESKVGLTRKI